MRMGQNTITYITDRRMANGEVEIVVAKRSDWQTADGVHERVSENTTNAEGEQSYHNASI